MARVKSENLTIRINPVVKEALRRASEHDRRSVGNLIEVLVLDHCKKIGVDVPDPKARPAGETKQRTAKPRKG